MPDASQLLGLAGAAAGATGVGLPVTLGIAGLQAGLGTIQYLNALKQARQNNRPLYTIDPSYQYGVDLLKNTIGLPQSALNLYYQNIGQNTNSGINAILGAGSNANQISNLVGNQNRQYQSVLTQDALQRKQDLAGIIAAQQALADQKDKAFQINQYAPWADKAQAIANQKAAGIQNIFGGLNSVSGAFANNATSKLADSLSGLGMNKIGTTGSVQEVTTPDSGVNLNKIYQQWQQSQQPAYMQQPFYNQLPPQQLNFGQLNPNAAFFQNNPLPLNFGQWNPNAISLSNF